METNQTRDSCPRVGAAIGLPPMGDAAPRDAGAQATAAWVGLTGTGGPLWTGLCSPGTSGSFST